MEENISSKSLKWAPIKLPERSLKSKNTTAKLLQIYQNLINTKSMKTGDKIRVCTKIISSKFTYKLSSSKCQQLLPHFKTTKI